MPIPTPNAFLTLAKPLKLLVPIHAPRQRKTAQRLAGLGYVVLCADYIGDGEVLAMEAIRPRLGSAIADTTLLRATGVTQLRNEVPCPIP